MAVFNKYNCFVGDVAHGLHDMKTGSSHAYRIYLSNTAPNVATDTGYSGGLEIANGNGYTTLGASIGAITGVDTAGVFSFAGGASVQWTAAGGSIGPFRYAILYNATPAGTPVIGYWDYGTSITLTNGNTFTVALPNPILTLT